LTLYVESNFVLQLVLGQEELTAAERILEAAESGSIDLALPTFSLSEPFVRVARGIRDRQRLRTQFADQMFQLVRSSPHASEGAILQTVPEHFDRINTREGNRLTATVERILRCTRLIELNSTVFLRAIDYQDRFTLDIEDAIILSSVVTDLQSRRGLKRHLFATGNRNHFDKVEIRLELNRLDCDVTWTFADAVRQRRL
jgi:predicted nucleic acid-binding protein